MGNFCYIYIMKTKFILDIHSVLDIITNSSSELFVIDNETSVEVVEEILRSIVSKWNDDQDDPRQFNSMMTVRTLVEEDLLDAEDGWGWGYETPENLGKVIIESVNDNTIPWEIMERIQGKFETKRWHLG